MYNPCFLSQQNIYLNSPKEVKFINDLKVNVDIEIKLSTANDSFYLKDILPNQIFKIDAKSGEIESIRIWMQGMKSCLIDMSKYRLGSVKASLILELTC